jgi:two-component system response regulator HydG
MTASSVLFVHQDMRALEKLVHAVPKGVGCQTSTRISGVFEALRAKPCDAVVLEVRGESARRFEDLERIRREHPTVRVILAAAQGGVEEAVEAIKRGAFHYVAEPWDEHALRGALDGALASPRKSEATNRGTTAGPSEAMIELVGSGRAIQQLRETIELVAASSAPVLVTGESGAGKELVARAIHAKSARRSQPFVAVNMSAIPEELLEAEMFGHVRGGFTGAAQSRKGLLTEASGGSLLLDEIGDMQIGLQAKVLRVLQFGEVRPVGSDRPHRVDVRIIAATHRDVPALIRAGRFREDLFFRLNVLPVVVPPLRDRREDIPELVDYLFARARARCPNSPVRSIEHDALEVLCRAPWPGNVRELESVVERLVVMGRTAAVDATSSGLSGALQHASVAPPSALGEHRTLRRVMLAYAEQVLQQTGGNKQLAAEILDVDLSTIYRWERARVRRQRRAPFGVGGDAGEAVPPSS